VVISNRKKWLKPIGRKLVINDGITGITHPETLDDFSDMIIALCDKVSLSEENNPPQIDLSKYSMTAECEVFTPWFAQDEHKFAPRLPENVKTYEFPGTCGSINVAKIPSDSLYMMRFKFTLEQTQAVRVMLNTPANSRVWIDGEYAFGREGGRMAPSFHRCPINRSMSHASCS
jgi:hypothetical protein